MTDNTNRVGGILSITVDGRPQACRGSFAIMSSSVKREGIAGQNAVHGYTEKPVVPSIKGDLTTVPGLSLEALQGITNSTIIASLANGKSYVLRNAWTLSAFSIDTESGKVGVEFEGLSCDEI